MEAPQDNPLCGFCNRGNDAFEECGPLWSQLLGEKVVAAHQRCMQYSSGLVQSTFKHFGGFEIEDVENEIQRGKKLSCTWCKKQKKRVGFRLTGATAGCEIERCKHSYHYYCARLHAVTSRRKRKESNNRQFLLYRVFCGQEHKAEYVETKRLEGVDEHSSSETDYENDSSNYKNDSSDDGSASSSFQKGKKKCTKSRTDKNRRSISAIQSSVMKGGTSSSSSASSPSFPEDETECVTDLVTKGSDSRATANTIDENDHTDEEINEIMKHKKDRCANQKKKTSNGKLGISTCRRKSNGSKGKSSADSDSDSRNTKETDKGSKIAQQNLQKSRINSLVIIDLSIDSDKSEDENSSKRKATKRKGQHLEDSDSSCKRLSKQKQNKKLSETVSVSSEDDDELPNVSITSNMHLKPNTVRDNQEPEKEQDSLDSFSIDSDTGCEQPVKQKQIKNENQNDTRINENALNERVNEESTVASEQSDRDSDSISLDPDRAEATSSVNFLGIKSYTSGAQHKPSELNPVRETVLAKKRDGNVNGDLNISSRLNSGSGPDSVGDATEAFSGIKHAGRNFVEKTDLRWQYCIQPPDLHALVSETSFFQSENEEMDRASDAAKGTGIEPWWDTLKDEEECILVIPSDPKKLENMLALLQQKLVEEQKIRAEHVHFWNAITPFPLHTKFMLYYLADVAEALVENVEKAKIKQHCNELQLYLLDHQTIQNQCNHIYAMQSKQNWGLDHVQDWARKIRLSFSRAQHLTQYPIGMFTSWSVAVSGVDTTINYALIFLNNMSDPDQSIRAALHKEVAMYNWLGGDSADAESFVCPSFSGLPNEQMEAYKLQETFLLKNWLSTTFRKFCKVVTLPHEDIFRHSGGDDDCFKSLKESVDAMSIEAEPNFPVAFFVHKTNPEIVQFFNFLQACLGKYSSIFQGHRLLWVFHANCLRATGAQQIFDKVSGQYRVRLLSAFNPANKPISVMVADMNRNN